MTSNSKLNSVDNVVLNGILTALKTSGNTTNSQWRGTMTELNSVLTGVYNKNKTNTSNLPGSPSALRVVVNRIANRLRTRGVSVRFGRTNDRTRTRFVRFVR